MFAEAPENMSIALCNQGLIETLGGQNLINTIMEQSEQVCESPIMQSFGRQYSGERKSARAEFLGIWVTLGYRKSATKSVEQWIVFRIG
jgi:hypothetical protein